MKVTFDIKNASKAIRPQSNDVIMFDGKDYYITTKDELLKEEKQLLLDCKKELKRVKEENEKFKKEISAQILDMSEIIKQMYTNRGE